ncbi:hypothetical protein AURDEDRAFT_170968 [Auricularia subglabra TFB-10046 SS5]|nr:hypothetical protein AURDEDRAFT_170968 [Auricularia subglabra TFB-10046 SS5]
MPTSGQELVDFLKLSPQTVLLTNPAILKLQRPHAALLEWTRAGGNVVICGLFSIEVDYARLADMFRDWGLDWGGGSYHRTDFVLAPAFASTPGLPASYNVKTSHICVPPHARVYVPAPNARTQSHVFEPQSVDQTEACVARCPGPPLTGFATATIRWRPNACVRDEAPELMVAIGRGGAPFVWQLLRIGPGGDAGRFLHLSTPATPEDTRDPPVRTGGTVFTCHMPGETLLFSELARAGLVDSGRSATMRRGVCVEALKEVLLPPEDCVRWCAGCHKWEQLGGRRYLRCSGCKSRFYCSPACQTRDWRAYHKYICGPLKEGKEPEVERLRLALQN